MIPAEKTLEALEQWALDELRQIGARNFELAKFFFGVSAASFAMLPFIEDEISIDHWTKWATLILLGGSVVSSILMTSPAKFEINSATKFADEHSKYAIRVRMLRRLWMALWLGGVTTGFIAFGAF